MPPQVSHGRREHREAIGRHRSLELGGELAVTSDGTAYALTRSAGTRTVRATGKESAESNREIFLFQRTGTDGWKIARYMFNKPA